MAAGLGHLHRSRTVAIALIRPAFLLLLAIQLVWSGPAKTLSARSSDDPQSAAGAEELNALTSALNEAVNGSAFENVSVFLGDGSGISAFAKGDGAPDWEDAMPVASASKWVAAMVLMFAVQDGQLSLESRPSELLSPSWSTEGPASRLTLAHLMSFTSGFNRTQANTTCSSFAVQRPIQECARELSAGFANMTSEPGTTFAYYNENLEVAAGMAEVATGKSWDELYEQYLRGPLALSNDTRFDGPGGVAGNLRISPADYTAIMLAHALPPYEDGLLESSVAKMNEDHTAEPQVSLDESRTFSGLFYESWPTWHYGYGHWLECPQGAGDWLPECTEGAQGGVHSSIGALGFYPIVDYAPRENYPQGYFLLIVPMAEFGAVAIPPEDSPMVRSLELADALRGVIDQALPPTSAAECGQGRDCAAAPPPPNASAATRANRGLVSVWAAALFWLALVGAVPGFRLGA
eukprot:jgi/Tetstr1/433839/TSEL_023024.t1